MASTLLIRSSAFPSGHRKPDTHRTSTKPQPSWWTPLFGWSSNPDYIDGGEKSQSSFVDLEVSSSSSSARSKFTPGGFTEEKAKQLRMKTAEMSNFHDIMYHSAIASRMASDRNGSLK